MSADQPLAVNLLDPHSLPSSFGAFGIFLVLVAETGLLIGIFLPGDSLLFTAGLLCATRATNQVHLSLPAVLVAAFIVKTMPLNPMKILVVIVVTYTAVNLLRAARRERDIASRATAAEASPA